MIIDTGHTNITPSMIRNYFGSMVNRLFKILPIKESGEKSLPIYIDSLKLELIGLDGLSVAIDDDNNLLTLISILQYFSDNCDSIDVKTVKREVFRAIGICNSLKDRYGVEL